MKNIVNFDFGQLRFEKNYVIGIMKEGSHLDPATNNILLSYCRDYFMGKPYAYISHRIHSYSVDPTVYIDAAKQEGLEAIAVVSENPITSTNVLIEKQFFNQPFESFTTIEGAKNWLSQILVS